MEGTLSVQVSVCGVGWGEVHQAHPQVTRLGVCVNCDSVGERERMF